MVKKLLFVIVLSISCSNKIDPFEKLENDLIGKWEWLSTVGKGFSQSPSTEGYTKKLNFLTGRMVEIYINDTLEITKSYTLYHPSYSESLLSLYVDDSTYGPVIFKGDSLILDSSYHDGPFIFYRRIK